MLTLSETHRYLLLLYLRVSLLTILCFGALVVMVPKINTTRNNATWNSNAISICANVTKTHTVQFYHTYEDPTYSQPEIYYDGYVTVAYLNYTYNFRKFSWYSNHTQLKDDLKHCCSIGKCVNIYYNKYNPSDASSKLMETYTFPLWISGLIASLIVICCCLFFSYRYDRRHHDELLSIFTLAKDPFGSGLLRD